MATAQKYHPGSLITESLLFPAHVCFECDLPLFDPTVRHFLVPHDLKELAGMKCALLTTHTKEHTVTGGFYCPARVNRSHLIDICDQSKEWVLYHNLNRVCVEAIQVEHGDFFTLCEKVPGKEWPPSHPFSRTSSMAHIRTRSVLIFFRFRGLMTKALVLLPPRLFLLPAKARWLPHHLPSPIPWISTATLLIFQVVPHTFSWVEDQTSPTQYA